MCERTCGRARFPRVNLWAGEQVTGRTGGRAGPSSFTSSFSPPRRCVVPTPRLAVAASLTSHPTLSSPRHCVAPHRRRITVAAAAIAAAAAAALASPPPPLLPCIATSAAVSLASPSPLLSPSRRHLRRCHPRVATSAAVTLASPPPPPSPPRRRCRHPHPHVAALTFARHPPTRR